MINIRKHSVLACALLCSGILITACSTPSATKQTENAAASVLTDSSWARERQNITDALANSDVNVLPQEDGALLLRLPAAEGFDKDSDKPTTSLLRHLNEVAAILAGAPQTTVQIVGHTDSVGSEIYNLQLSIRRAEAVMEYLRQNGIELKRLSTDGHGEDEPIADNRTPEGRAENRRVEMLVQPFKALSD